MIRLLTAFFASLFLFSGSATAWAQDPPEAEEESKKEETQFVPLPVYATTPNEGATYGFMPVFLLTDETGRIGTIVAPSVTWNAISRTNFTARYFYYPTDYEEINFQATYATRLFKDFMFQKLDAHRTAHRWTHEIGIYFREDPFRRFYGIGKDTQNSGKSSYLLRHTRLLGRAGYNLDPRWNVYGMGSFNAFRPVNEAVPGLSGTFTKFKSTPGLSGSMQGMLQAGIKFDTREVREYSENGALLDASLGAALTDHDNRSQLYGVAKVEGKYLLQESSFTQTAARALWTRVYGSNLPFYERPSLGGSFTLRGYSLDRFVDDAAWTLDLEQRISVVVMRLFGCVVHFRVDPFLSLGQVYQDSSELLARPQFTQGIGFRGFVPPSVVGRVDVAHGGGELNTYVELGYAF